MAERVYDGVIMTTLSMTAAPAREPCLLPQGFRVEVAPPSLAEYRALYEKVGRAHAWIDRKRMSNAALGAIIHHPKVVLHLARDAEGKGVGFSELDLRTEQEATLALLGITPEVIGLGLGRALLDRTIAAAFAAGAARLFVSTCTLDHRRALPLYQRAGFGVVAQRSIRVIGDAATSLRNTA